MSTQPPYEPGPAGGAHIQKEGEKWTLVLVRDLRHAPEKVWRALTEPEHLREWAPFVADANMGSPGKVNLTWVGAPAAQETTVALADPPRTLQYNDVRWELEPLGAGTRLRLWHNIDRRFIAMGAAGWHICFDVLERLLAGTPIGRMAGPEVMKFAGWQRLHQEYAREFNVEMPGWPGQTANKG